MRCRLKLSADMPADLSGRIVLRWDSTANCAALLEAGGVDAVWLRTADDNVAAACRAAGVEVIPAGAIRLADREEFGLAQPAETVAVGTGMWPGAEASRRTGDGAFVAGATTRAWVTANGYLVAWLRALYPDRSPVLGYAPGRGAGVDAGQVLPFGSLELALVDAWTAGGNYILAPDVAYQDALLGGNRTALAAWTQMGRTARWLKEHRSLFGQPAMGTITVLVGPGGATAEIAKLMFRQSASPDLVSTKRAPAPDPANRLVVVAAGIAAPSAELRRVLLAHARAGASVVTDAYGSEAWWRAPGLRLVRGFEDREFYALGSGRIVAYKEQVADPGEFALDAIDLAGDRRPARIWNCPGGIALASKAGPAAKAAFDLINYGSPARGEALARRYGVFRSATLLRPEEAATPLRTYRRGGSTEVVLPAFNRLAVVVFD